jgi:hypothetical protein
MENVIQPTQFSLAHKYIGEIRGTFFVPDYQRGYRWDADDVQHLLDDIWDSKGKDYSLQPVVVKLHKENDGAQGQEWELIDGQQRLTTLYLIFFYMRKQGWKKMAAPYLISYKTRPDSAAYLETLDPKKHKTNIDYFHLYKAYERIEHWFKGHGDDYSQAHVAAKFDCYLFESVRVIWYEVSANIHSTELFTRLNMGRIPLTDAELVKAQLLTGMRNMQADRAQEVAAQWDGIERDLRNPDIWAFVARTNASDDAERYPTRISLLLDTLADAQDPPKLGEKRPRHHTFDTLRGQSATPQNRFWDVVLELHALILGWFGTPHLYNKIGFLVATGTTLGTLVRLAKGKTKSDFEKSLIERISRKINICESGLLDLRYDKKSDHSKILTLLLLMNVETISRTGQRFPFRRHIEKAWSLEHIHAQNSESLTKVAQWKMWLEVHQKALGTLPNQQTLSDDIAAALRRIDTESNFGSTFQRLAARVMDVFSSRQLEASASNHDLHSISNLALLSSGDNSTLSNAVFEVKRQIILEIDRNMDGKKDGYIPVCTRNVFLKYYADADAQQIHFWSLQDRESYFKAMISTLETYLTPETNAKVLVQ